MQWFLASRKSEHIFLLDEEERRHCIQSLRKKEGDSIFVFDGKGGLFSVRIAEITKREVLLDWQADLPWHKPWNFELKLAFAPTKNMDRSEWMLEKAVELGVDAFYPIICQQSERRKLRIDRLQKQLLSAAKQSHKAQLPFLAEPQDFLQCLDAVAAQERAYIAYCDKELASTDILHIPFERGSTIWLFIGPEGDFSPAEVEAFLQKTGGQAISLGSSRLRSETAALSAIQSIHALDRLINR